MHIRSNLVSFPLGSLNMINGIYNTKKAYFNSSTYKNTRSYPIFTKNSLYSRRTIWPICFNIFVQFSFLPPKQIDWLKIQSHLLLLQISNVKIRIYLGGWAAAFALEFHSRRNWEWKQHPRRRGDQPLSFLSYLTSVWFK